MTRLDPAVLLPHRWPMALLDEAEFVERDATLVGRWTVRADDPWCQAAGMPPHLVLESWLQACAALVCAGRGSASRVFVGGLRGVRVAGPVKVGETVEHRVRVLRGLAATGVCAGVATVAGRIVVTVEQASISVETDGGAAARARADGATGAAG